jgi:hypothetical protein
MANDAADVMAKPRMAVARAIAEHKAFTAAAGTEEMRRVTNSLQLLGMAYSHLQPSSDNPAWDE